MIGLSHMLATHLALNSTLLASTTFLSHFHSTLLRYGIDRPDVSMSTAINRMPQPHRLLGRITKPRQSEADAIALFRDRLLEKLPAYAVPFGDRPEWNATIINDLAQLVRSKIDLAHGLLGQQRFLVRSFTPRAWDAESLDEIQPGFLKSFMEYGVGLDYYVTYCCEEFREADAGPFFTGVFESVATAASRSRAIGIHNVLSMVRSLVYFGFADLVSDQVNPIAIIEKEPGTGPESIIELVRILGQSPSPDACIGELIKDFTGYHWPDRPGPPASPYRPQHVLELARAISAAKITAFRRGFFLVELLKMTHFQEWWKSCQQGVYPDPIIASVDIFIETVIEASGRRQAGPVVEELCLRFNSTMESLVQARWQHFENENPSPPEEGPYR